MVDVGLTPRSALAGHLHSGHRGRAGSPGVSIEERTGLEIVTVAGRGRDGDALRQAARRAFGLDLPETPRRVGDARLTFLWAGAMRWMAVSEAGDGSLDHDVASSNRAGDMNVIDLNMIEHDVVRKPVPTFRHHALETTLRDGFGGLASLTDQSDGRVVLRLSGPSVRDLLGKALSIDLHPRAFRPGDVALTPAFHIAAQVWQIDEAPTYDLSVGRSMVGSLAAWMVQAAEDYGVEVVGGA